MPFVPASLTPWNIIYKTESPLFFQYEPAVVGKAERGKGKGNDEPDESQQRAPHRQGQQYDGRVEPHDMTHDARREVHVLYGLHHGKHRQCHEQDNPKVLSRLDALHQCQDDGGYEADELQVGHQIEDADKQSEADGKGEVNNEKPDGEQDAYDKCNERLPTEIGVHAVLHIGDKPCEELALVGRNQPHPTL